MIDLSRYRVIDLSVELIPAERKRDGRYLPGRVVADRPLEVEEIDMFNARMHLIRGHTHTGTHIECPYKYADAGADFGDLPPNAFMGEAAACNFSTKKPGEGITGKDFAVAGVKSGDVVLAWGPPGATMPEGMPHFTNEAVDWLISAGIKLLGTELLLHSPPGTPWGRGDTDHRLLERGIMFVDFLSGLSQITRPRVFFIALPVRMRRVTATWTRAIVLEDLAS